MTTKPAAAPSSPARLLSVLAGGLLFGLGLSVSRMIRPEIVLDFLQLRDMGLLLVLGGATGVTFVVYQLAPRVLSGPLCGGSFASRPGKLDWRTGAGAALFGAGWGLCGVCPGPALAGLGAGLWRLGWAVLGLSAGAWLHGWYASRG